ncbi:hypothetical protein RCO48_30725 [Peribacillus frigoritolerans]|nr:hypothetical protein [Peribacillus frigoritolerans]
MIGAGVRDSCGNSESKGDPTGASAPRSSRTALRKASALTFQSTSKFVQAKKCRQTRFFIEFDYSQKQTHLEFAFFILNHAKELELCGKN